MHLLSSYIKNETIRSAVRFTVVGCLGTGIQYFYYDLLIRVLPDWPTVSLTISFLLEAISNYLMTSYYTFRSRPSWKNAAGFAIARSSNLVFQLAFLNIFLLFLDQQWSGILSIVVAGIINYFVTRFFFSKPTQQV